MKDTVNETTFTAEEMAAMRAQVGAIMKAEDKSQAETGREIGLADSTFHAWFNGKYPGDNDKVAASVQVWLTAREEHRRAASRVPVAPAFIETQTAGEIMDALRFAQVMPEITVVAGAAGVGKTTTGRQYARTNPNVWFCTMDPSSKGVNPMLQELCEVMRVSEKSPAKLARAIGRRVQDTGGLIIIDEAQHLSTEALDQLRSIYDRYGVGIALMGNETVYARLEGQGRKAEFAQLYSRIGHRLNRARPLAKDICPLIAAWKITDPEMVRFLKAVASKPGALRSMTKVLQVASMLAAGGRKPLALDHLKAAYAKHSPTVQAE